MLAASLRCALMLEPLTALDGFTLKRNVSGSTRVLRVRLATTNASRRFSMPSLIIDSPSSLTRKLTSLLHGRLGLEGVLSKFHEVVPAASLDVVIAVVCTSPPHRGARDSR